MKGNDEVVGTREWMINEWTEWVWKDEWSAIKWMEGTEMKRQAASECKWTEDGAQGASEINQFQLNVMNSMKFDDLTASERGPFAISLLQFMKLNEI